MRATHVITRLIVGGAQENTIASVLGLNAMPGFEVALAAGPTRGAEGSLESAFRGREHLLITIPHLVRAIRPWHEVRAFGELHRLFALRRPQLVHTHSGKAGVLGRLAAAYARVPMIVHTIHGPSFGAFQGKAANMVFKGAERVAGRVTTHFVAVADAMKHQYLEAGIGRPAQYSTIHSGFDLAPFASARNSAGLRMAFGLERDAVVVGKIGRLFELKGHDDLLEASGAILQDYPKIQFLIVGDGPWRERLQQKARALGVASRFVFTGLVPPPKVAEFVGVMDILVHLSRREGLARAIPQALAAGVPVVAYDCDGASEVCQNARTGFLIKPGDLAGLTAAVVRLAGNASLRHELGECGRRLVHQKFRVDAMVKQLALLYKELAMTRGISISTKSEGTR